MKGIDASMIDSDLLDITGDSRMVSDIQGELCRASGYSHLSSGREIRTDIISKAHSQRERDSGQCDDE